ncbi:MAG: nitroreductase [Ignavibacteria bacterium]|jgi:nitroreductase|nr:nitroreductase [Ignavibacteria bacterium]MCU7503530.1 nitroreductase [Ignavibacteria bacterium]MCU7517276.1 nitroreductase [Ignavibacteria bacterium]
MKRTLSFLPQKFKKGNMVHDLIKKRYSTRTFSEKLIDSDIILSLFEAARWAPSGGNEQPWRFIIAGKNDPENYWKIFSAINEGNKLWAINAPLLVVGVTKLERGIDKKLNKYAFYDLASAVANLTLQATSKNLYVRQMGGFNPLIIRELFDIPENFEPAIVLAAGYKTEESNIPENLMMREKAPRQRKPLSEIVFSGKFGTPADLVKQKEEEQVKEEK